MSSQNRRFLTLSPLLVVFLLCEISNLGGGGLLSTFCLRGPGPGEVVKCPRLSTRGGEGVKIGQILVHVVVECPLIKYVQLWVLTTDWSNQQLNSEIFQSCFNFKSWMFFRKIFLFQNNLNVCLGANFFWHDLIRHSDFWSTYFLI